MSEICVFAGTTEGRELIGLLTSKGLPVYGCVATEYGQTLLEESENLTVSSQRLTQEEMETLFRKEQFRYVVDATHPYAAVVTENIRAACGNVGVPYLRLLRQEEGIPDDAIYARDTAHAVELLQQTKGNILLTTGSKELHAYAALPDFAQRVYARVLPMDSSLEICKSCGLPPAHILAMQGPFTLEMNIAMLRMIHAEILVTKEAGNSGGFPEKVEAARQAGCRLLVIGRPQQVEGKSFRQIADELLAHYGISCPRKISIVGIGTGNPEELTEKAKSAVAGAQCLIGAKRMLEAVAAPGQITEDAISPEKIVNAIHAHPECERFCIVMSGDIGFFSGTKKLLPMLGNDDVTLIPGLPSLVSLCARLGTSYEDVVCASAHGRDASIMPTILKNARVFALVGGENGMAQLCAKIAEAGLPDAKVSVGERLGYEDEKITVGTAAQLAGGSFNSLSVALIEHTPTAIVTHGLPDEEFLRNLGTDAKVVPMTKMEVRAVALSKLALTDCAVCYDIGAGTGSVSIEMARMASHGTVYAVEKREDALELLAKNQKQFYADNMTIVPGLAPEACRDLPAPTHVFIGGSSGNIKEILHLCLEKNPKVRIVATAIALETVAELTDCLHDPAFTSAEAVSLTIAREKKAGPYHLMTGQNPIYIFTFQG